MREDQLTFHSGSEGVCQTTPHTELQKECLTSCPFQDALPSANLQLSPHHPTLEGKMPGVHDAFPRLGKKRGTTPSCVAVLVRRAGANKQPRKSSFDTGLIWVWGSHKYGANSKRHSTSSKQPRRSTFDTGLFLGFGAMFPLCWMIDLGLWHRHSPQGASGE